MSFRLLIKPPAEKDIDEIYAWYNLERQTLGDDFLKELERSFEFIKGNPAQYQVRYKKVRMVKIKRFPICIYFTIQDETCFILAVLSTHRNPRIWTERK